MFDNDGSEKAEQEIIDAQKAPVSELLCCSCDCEVVAPSERIRKGFLAAFPDNAATTVYIKGDEDIMGRKLSELE